MFPEPQWECVPKEYKWAFLRRSYATVYWVYVICEPKIYRGVFREEYPIFSRKEFESYPVTNGAYINLLAELRQRPE